MKFQVLDCFYAEAEAESDDSDCEELTVADDVIKLISGTRPKPKFDSDISEINYLLDGLKKNNHTVTGVLRDGSDLEVILCVSGSGNRVKFAVNHVDLSAIELTIERVIVIGQMRPQVWEFLRSAPVRCELEFTAHFQYTGLASPLSVNREERIQVLNNVHSIVVSDPFYAFGSMGKEFSLLVNLGSLTINNLIEADPASTANVIIMLDYLPPGVEFLTLSKLVSLSVFESFCRLVKRHAKLRYVVITCRMCSHFEQRIIKKFIQERKIHVKHQGCSTFTRHVNFSESDELETMLYLIGMYSESSFSAMGSDMKRLLVTLMFGEFPSTSFLEPRSAGS